MVEYPHEMITLWNLYVLCVNHIKKISIKLTTGRCIVEPPSGVIREQGEWGKLRREQGE